MRRYVVTVAAVAATAVALVGALYALADPQRILGTPGVRGLTLSKPYLEHNRELARWRVAARICPDAGIFGNSRAEIGFDPLHPGFARHGLSAFNHAIPGRNLDLARDQLLWLRQAGCPLRLAVVGVDFADFVAPRGRSATGPLPAPRMPPSLDPAFVSQSVFSLTGLADAARTLLVQWLPYAAVSTERGLNPMHHYVGEVRAGGYEPLFRQRAQENAKAWRRRVPSVVRADGSSTSEFAVLDAVITDAAADGAKVILVTYPYHAQLRLMVERMGFGDAFDEWKRRVLALVERARARGADVELWDFALLDDVTSEPIPRRGDTSTPMRGYWEAGHFKRELGDQMLAQVLESAPGFGVRLDSSILEPTLRADRARLAEMVRTSAGGGTAAGKPE